MSQKCEIYCPFVVSDTHAAITRIDTELCETEADAAQARIQQKREDNEEIDFGDVADTLSGAIGGLLRLKQLYGQAEENLEQLQCRKGPRFIRRFKLFGPVVDIECRNEERARRVAEEKDEYI